MSNWREQLEPILEHAKTLSLPLIGGFFLIIYAAVGLVYIQERQAQTHLIAEIEILDRLLQLAGLQEPLENVQAQAKQVTSVIPGSILPDQDVFPGMRRLADEGGVVIQSQKSRAPRRTQFGESAYEAYPFDLTILGSYVGSMNFVALLEFQEVIPTLIIRKVSIEAAAETGTAAIPYEVVARTKS